MTEVRLTIQEQDRRHALGSNKREGAKVDICGYKDSEQEREGLQQRIGELEARTQEAETRAQEAGAQSERVVALEEQLNVLNELLKSHLEAPGGLGAPSFVIVASQKAFDNLTAENKTALMKASGEAGAALIGKAWLAADERGREDAKQKGQTTETLAPAEFEKWKPLLKPVTDDWVKKVDQKGQDGRKLLEDLEAMIKAASS